MHNIKKHHQSETDKALDKMRILQSINANISYCELLKWEKVLLKGFPYKAVFEKRCEVTQCEAEKAPTDIVG